MSGERSIPSAATDTDTDTDTTDTVTTTSTSISASTYSYYHAPSLFPVVDKVLLIDPDDAQTGLPLPSISISPTKLGITDQDASLNPTINETYTGKIIPNAATAKFDFCTVLVILIFDMWYNQILESFILFLLPFSFFSVQLFINLPFVSSSI